MPRFWIPLVVLGLSLGMPLAAGGDATEGLLNKLLAPGPLIEGHKDLEGSKCLECHVPRGGIPDAKCLKCHEQIQSEMTRKSGFHGLMTKTCISCHTDHKGRDFDTTHVDEKSFDHRQTGYNLTGKHAELKCTECHIEKRKQAFKSVNVNRPNDPHWIGLKVTCVSCHKKDDPHFFTGKRKNEDCSACHSSGSWKKGLKFDHEKDGRFKLVGRHARLTCAECHVPKKEQPSIYHWAGLKEKQCLACHEDQHKGKFTGKFAGGAACVKCHTQETWKIEKFDHSVTGYTLRGKHATLQCSECHKQAGPKVAFKDFKFTGLKTACLACHKDEHRFGNFRSSHFKDPSTCTACHNERTWKETSFDHNTRTSYPITGKHIGLECTKCHVPDPQTGNRARIYHWEQLAQKNCETCHNSPHKSTFNAALLKKACTECHVDEGWHILVGKNGKRFDHATTRFSLTGRHAQIKCSDCHRVDNKDIYHFGNADKGFCIDCHQNVHTQQFHRGFSELPCTTCHETRTWSERKAFNHDATAFTLTDAHANLKCEQCHTASQSQFPLIPGQSQRHSMSKFQFAGRSQQFCGACHGNPHLGQMDRRTAEQGCTTCHTKVDFTHRLPFNHDKTSYPLKGKHSKVSCQKCHVATAAFFKPEPSRPNESPHVKSKMLFPEIASRSCVGCHKDPHEGHYGKTCAQCHNESDWRAGAADFHKNFSLQGVHYALRCNECHAGGRKLAGLSQDCIGCHMKDDIHHAALPDCGKCHEQNFWEYTFFKHSMTSFPLRGYHRTIDCSACHSNNIYKGLPSACVNCHLNDALSFAGSPNHVTQGLISRNCADCHNQFSFH